MFATKRRLVPQYDLQVEAGLPTSEVGSARHARKSSQQWKDRLSDDGLAIVDQYLDVGVDLETVAYSDNETFVLYFPTGSG